MGCDTQRRGVPEAAWQRESRQYASSLVRFENAIGYRCRMAWYGRVGRKAMGIWVTAEEGRQGWVCVRAPGCLVGELWRVVAVGHPKVSWFMGIVGSGEACDMLTTARR
jgi:hypothetical protein